MKLQARTFWLPKDPGFDLEYEDAFAVREVAGLAAIADGVSNAMFSRAWARLLTSEVIVAPPDPAAADDYRAWLARQRTAWRQEIDLSKLNYFQREKLRRCGGAFATLLWVQIRKEENGDGCRFHWQAFATGDSGLIHVRAGLPLQWFPIATAADLQADPITISSVDFGKDHVVEFRSATGELQENDLLVMCTDALLGWALNAMEAEQPPPWEQYWDMPEEVWRQEIITLRDEHKMRRDDTTLILLRVAKEAVPEPAAPEAILEEQETPAHALAEPIIEAPPATPESGLLELGAVPTVVEAASATGSEQEPGTSEPEPEFAPRPVESKTRSVWSMVARLAGLRDGE